MKGAGRIWPRGHKHDSHGVPLTDTGIERSEARGGAQLCTLRTRDIGGRLGEITPPSKEATVSGDSAAGQGHFFFLPTNGHDVVEGRKAVRAAPD